MLAISRDNKPRIVEAESEIAAISAPVFKRVSNHNIPRLGSAAYTVSCTGKGIKHNAGQ